MSNTERYSSGEPRYLDYDAFKAFIDSYFSDRKKPDERELHHAFFTDEIKTVEPEITVDDLERAYEITSDILKSAKKEYLIQTGTKEPLNQIGIMRLMLAIGCIPYWEAHGPALDRTWGLGPIVEKWRDVLRKKGKME